IIGLSALPSGPSGCLYKARITRSDGSHNSARSSVYRSYARQESRLHCGRGPHTSLGDRSEQRSGKVYVLRNGFPFRGRNFLHTGNADLQSFVERTSDLPVMAEGINDTAQSPAVRFPYGEDL